MSGTFTVRLSIAVGIMAVCFGVLFYTSRHVVPLMDIPQWHLKQCPLELGSWSGVEQALDPELFSALRAVDVEDRQYHNRSGAVVLVHTAVFDNSEDGIGHSPVNCYKTHGWKLLSDEFYPLSDNPAQPEKMRVLTWEQKGEKCLVGYWFGVGEDQIFDRLDFTKLRCKHFGRSHWPPLVKVLLHISLSDQEKDLARLRDIGLQIYHWLHQVQGLSAIPLPDGEQPPAAPVEKAALQRFTAPWVQGASCVPLVDEKRPWGTDST
jgi:hypothetical protein